MAAAVSPHAAVQAGLFHGYGGDFRQVRQEKPRACGYGAVQHVQHPQQRLHGVTDVGVQRVRVPGPSCDVVHGRDAFVCNTG